MDDPCQGISTEKVAGTLTKGRGSSLVLVPSGPLGQSKLVSVSFLSESRMRACPLLQRPEHRWHEAVLCIYWKVTWSCTPSLAHFATLAVGSDPWLYRLPPCQCQPKGQHLTVICLVCHKPGRK
jgi:hypothetical protein